MAESCVAMDIAYKLSNSDRNVKNLNIAIDPSLIGRPDDLEFVLGKSSGKNSIKLFLDKYGIEATNEQIQEILDMVKAEAMVTKDLVSEGAFRQFVTKVCGK